MVEPIQIAGSKKKVKTNIPEVFFNALHLHNPCRGFLFPHVDRDKFESQQC
jgi:hypothetical protein